MKLSEFQKQPGGDFLFDFYAHPVLVPSSLGDFRVEMFVAAKERPTERMAGVANRLVEQFRKDEEGVARLVYDDYLARCANPETRSRLEASGVEPDLPRDAILKYLEPRILEVADDLRAIVFIGPDWDREMGLCIEYRNDGWVKIDP